MMGVRIVCFVLMVLITPYGWYTWIFGLAAVFLPYIAVVSANVARNVRTEDVENPKRMLPAGTQRDPEPPGPATLRIDESKAEED